MLSQLFHKLFGLAIAAVILLGSFSYTHTQATQSSYTQHLNNLLLFTGEQGRKQLQSLTAASPDLAQIYTDGVYGDVLSRKILNNRDRRIVAIAALIAMGVPNDQLRPHLEAALKSDLSATELEDLIIQTAAYTGFYKPINAMLVLSKIPAYQQRKPAAKQPNQRQAAERYQIGSNRYSQLDAAALGNLRTNFDKMSPDLVNSTFRLFGDLYARDALDLRTRQLAVVSTLAAMGTAPRQLTFHIGTALNVGVKREEIMEIMILMQPHAGMPAAYNGMFAAKEAFEKRDAISPPQEAP